MKYRIEFPTRILACLLALALPADAALRALPEGPVRTPPIDQIAAVLGNGPEETRVRTFHAGDDEDDFTGLRGGPLAPVMTSDGVLFRFEDDGAYTVSIVGDFNDWDGGADPMRRHRDGVWKASVELDGGRYGYLFVVDGEWLRDPDNPILTVVESTEVPESVGTEVSMVHVARDRVALPRPFGHRDAETDLAATYDRVNQIALFANVNYRNRSQMHPDLALSTGWSFGRDRWLYDVALTQPLFGAEILDLGGAAYRRNATSDGFRLGSTENSLAAFFFRQDWYDHFEAEGVSGTARLHAGSDIDLGVHWRGEDHTSVSKTTDWGLFDGGKRMRINAPVTEGELRSLAAFWEVDTRNHDRSPTRGFLGQAVWEWAGGEFGGDFEFRRGVGDLRRYVKLSPDHYLDLRVRGGVIDEARRSAADGTPLRGFEAVPVQERFYLGGIGTMRATQFKSLPGDRLFLANAEMRLEIWDDFQVVLFGDFGDAWVEATQDFELKTDAGIGFQDSEASFRVNLARKMDSRSDEDDSVWVSARINRMF